MSFSPPGMSKNEINATKTKVCRVFLLRRLIEFGSVFD
jgi:hypothetical protein